MSEPLRVAVNLTWLDPGRVGGSEEYLTRQLLGLAGDDLHLTIYGAPGLAEAHAGLAAGYPIEIARVATNRAGRIVAEHTWLAARTRTADVVHHGGGTAPVIGHRPVVLTVHDLQYLVHPDYFTTSRRAYLAAMVPRSARRAAVVAVPTAAVREHVLDAFGLAHERVVVVPHGVPDVLRPSDELLAAVRARYGLGGAPYVVYPAITHPHKGHRLLVDMLDHLDDGTRLVLIGDRGPAEDELGAAISDAGQWRRVVRPGRVPGADRDALIAGADALVFPSEFEGFGAPLVEAMVLDTPVVCSAARAVREVVGPAGVVVEDGPALSAGAAWAAGLQMARAGRVDLVDAGRVRRRDFSLERSGSALADAYRMAAAT